MWQLLKRWRERLNEALQQNAEASARLINSATTLRVIEWSVARRDGTLSTAQQSDQRQSAKE